MQATHRGSSRLFCSPQEYESWQQQQIRMYEGSVMWVEKEALVQLPWIPKWFYFCVRVGYCLLKCFLLIIIFINGYCPQAFLRYFMPSHCMWVLNIFHALHTTRLEMAAWEKQCKVSVLSFYLLCCVLTCTSFYEEATRLFSLPYKPRYRQHCSSLSICSVTQSDSVLGCQVCWSACWCR